MHRGQRPHQGLPQHLTAAQKHVLEDVSFTIERGDRIALVGANGAGKSTLIRMLSRPGGADRRRRSSSGHNVLADYFAQDQYKVLDPNAEMLDDITGVAPKVPVVELRSLLGCFMFSGDDVFKKLGVLSGGERNRYAMAKMLVSPVELPAARRADQPPRPARQGRAARRDPQLHRHGALRLARPLLHRRPRHARLRGRRRRVHIYPGNYEDYLWRKQGGPEKVKESLDVRHEEESVG